MTAEPEPDPDGAGPEASETDPADRLIAATGALIEAQRQQNDAVMRQLFAEFRALTTLLPGTVPPAGDDPDDEDDRFDDVPV